jgi:parallel beta-helix repeat protein
MRRGWVHVAAAAALGTVAALAPVGDAGAATLACGDIITQNTVLENDVGPCGVGIQIGADNITFDLNGHTIRGRPTPGDAAGIFLFRRTGVTVKNGAVRDFDGGVAIEGGSNNTVTAMSVVDNIGVVGVTKYADGIAILSSQNNQILRNNVVHNGPLSGIGLYTVVNNEHPRQTSGVSRGNLIDGNQVTDHTPARSAAINDNDGIRLETQVVFNTISNNTVVGSGLDGIAILSFAPDNTITGNTVQSNGFLNPFRRRGDGIRVFGASDRTTVLNNRAVGNAANGIILHGPFDTPSGPRPPVRNSTVIGNISVGNSQLPPLEQSQLGGPTFDLHDGNPDCDANVWRANVYGTAQPPCTTIGGQRAG